MTKLPPASGEDLYRDGLKIGARKCPAALQIAYLRTRRERCVQAIGKGDSPNLWEQKMTNGKDKRRAGNCDAQRYPRRLRAAAGGSDSSGVASKAYGGRDAWAE
jgi:hypothetical protein